MTAELQMHKALQEKAWSIAARKLEQLGFVQRSRGEWHNANVDWGHWHGPVQVHLSTDFPWALPEIFIKEDGDFRPHVNRQGKVCIAPETGLLLDFTRPARIIEDALAQAARLLKPEAPEQNAREFRREYESYWTADENSRALVCVPSGTPDGPLHGAANTVHATAVMAAPNAELLDAWATAAKLTGFRNLPCYFLKLASPLPVPHRSRNWTLEEYLAHLELRCTESQFFELLKWVQAIRIPFAVLTLMPSNEACGSVCTAYVPFPTAPHADRMARPFRKGKFPQPWAFKLALKEPIHPLRTVRLDHDFLVARAGGDPSLGTTRACVIGVGSVGSFFTMTLARSGVKSFRLIDPDHFRPANLYRHALGAPSLYKRKTEAIAHEITTKLPNIDVDYCFDSAGTVLSKKPIFVTDCDLVVCATGEETAELEISHRLPPNLHRMHVWVEPMGLGGHVLVLPKGVRSGCYRCLFDHNAAGELNNLASLAEPGQEFQRVLGGCAGSFTPFGASDAEIIAATAASWASRLLLGHVRRAILISWVNDRDTLVKAGFRLSKRGKELEERQMHLNDTFARLDCPACGGA